MNARGWVIAVVLALLVVGLLAFARGREHHRGDEVGALGGRAVVVQVAVS